LHIALRRLARTSGFFTTTWCATCFTVFSELQPTADISRDEDVTNTYDARSDQNQLARKSASDLDGRIPAILIDNERKRLPQALRPPDMIIDDDCPMCRMVGDETSLLGMGVGFWHLDGSNMDDDFAFSFSKRVRSGRSRTAAATNSIKS